MEPFLAESRNPKMAVCGFKVRHGCIHKKVCCCIYYGKDTVEMALFQKYEVFY